MPPVIALVGVIQAGIALAQAAQITIGMVIGFAAKLVGFVMSVASMFSSKPKKPTPASFTREAQQRQQLVRSSIEPHRWIYGTARVSGVVAYGTSSGEGKKYLHFVVPLAGHEVAGIDDVWINEYRITNNQLDGDGYVIAGDVSGLVRIKKYLGAVDQTADPDLMAQAPNSEWTSAHRLRNRAYIYLRVEFNDEKFRGGVSDVSALVRGRIVYDPRTGTSAFSDNAALCILDYIRSRPGLILLGDEWDPTWWSAEANYSDEQVVIKSDGTTQKRFRINGSFTLDQMPMDVLEDLQNACGGAVIDRNGKYYLYQARYDVPTGDLTDEHVVGPVRVKWAPSIRELFNGVRGIYIDPNKEWQPGDFPLVKNETYLAEDAGHEEINDIDFVFVNDPYQAQRLAKITLEAHRQGVTVTGKFRFDVAQYAVMEVVRLTLQHHGFQAKEFRIIKSTLNDDLTVDLILREESPEVYEWNYGEATTVDPSPNSSLYLPTSVLPPAWISVAEELYETRSGAGVKTKALVTWGMAEDPYIRYYELYYRVVGSPTWLFAGVSRSTRFDLEDLAPETYEIRVRSINLLDFASTYLETTKTLNGLLDPPQAPQDVSIQSISSLAVLRWTQVVDLDVRIGGRIEVRHTPLTSGATWEDSTSIAEAVSGRETMALVPLKAGTYLLKSVDSSGIYSTAATSVLTDGAVAVTYTDATTPLQEDTTFPGTKTNCAVNASKLELTGTTLWDDIAVNIDSVTDLIDGLGGQSLTGTYVFATTVDLATVKRVQLRSHIKAAVINTADLIDSRTLLIEDWTDFDGSVGARGDVVVYARTTPDNPAGSPTWSSWSRCDVSEVSARGVQFKAELMVDDKTNNIQISELRAYMKEVL
jgi:hypothetical protein